MRTITIAASLVLMGVAGAWSADCIVDGAPLRYTAPAPAGSDASLELTWDNGTRRWSVGWYTGADAWVGNDFDLSTISGYRAIGKVKFYTRSNWPNSQWDGFRLAFFNFRGSVPGSRLWPTASGGYFFKPSGLQGHVWVECPVGWTCPSTSFVAAEEQFYNWPYCDPWTVDNNPTFRRHSWNYYAGQWGPLSQVNVEISPYYNLMLRVVVDDETVGVAPTSLGRVKALYF